MGIKPMYSNITNFGKFSDWLKKELKMQDLTPTKLAKISGVHPNTIHNYLAERCEPTWFNAECLINALGYDLAVIPRDTK